jgi:hypothetical protein
MSTLTVPRPDVTVEEVSSALRQGLNPRYHVRTVSRLPVADRPRSAGGCLTGPGGSKLWSACFGGEGDVDCEAAGGRRVGGNERVVGGRDGADD